MGFLDKLKNDILIADGAIGTLLSSIGSSGCNELFNLTKPEAIKQIHCAYIDAGATVIQTNTYAANRLKLAQYGLEEQVAEINQAGVQHALFVAKEKEEAFVLGTMGGIHGLQKKFSLEEIVASFTEQLDYLLEGEIDGILLETYYDLEELETVLTLTRRKTDLPIIAQLALGQHGYLPHYVSVNTAFNRLVKLGANVVGLNCRLGPHHMLRALEQVELPKGAYLSAYPNASLPAYKDGEFYFGGNADYFKQSALGFRNEGVRLLGGCCGTTPEHIRGFAEALKHMKPIDEKKVMLSRPNLPISAVKKKEVSLHQIVARRSSLIVELDSPRNLATGKFFEGAKALRDVGIDALTMADNSLAQVRISNEAIGVMLKNEHQIRPLVHVACRDRNVLGLQSHLMGLYTLGIHDVLAVTGDLARVGNFPGASSVYDISSVQLISMMSALNKGSCFSGKELGQQTNFSIAAAFNPNVRSLEKEVVRAEKKIEAGAHYFMTQPVFSEKKLIELYEHTKHLEKPVYVGLMPLTGHRNAEFLHHEVPGITIDEKIRDLMRNLANDPHQAAKVGVELTKALVDVASSLFNGIYFITPFMRYEMSVELVKYAKGLEK